MERRRCVLFDGSLLWCSGRRGLCGCLLWAGTASRHGADCFCDCRCDKVFVCIRRWRKVVLRARGGGCDCALRYGRAAHWSIDGEFGGAVAGCGGIVYEGEELLVWLCVAYVVGLSHCGVQCKLGLGEASASGKDSDGGFHDDGDVDLHKCEGEVECNATRKMTAKLGYIYPEVRYEERDRQMIGKTSTRAFQSLFGASRQDGQAHRV